METKINFQLVQGRNKFNSAIDSNANLLELLQIVEELTGIPQNSQKLICQGQNLTSHDPEKTFIHQLKLVNGSKIMVLGNISKL